MISTGNSVFNVCDGVELFNLVLHLCFGILCIKKVLYMQYYNAVYLDKESSLQTNGLMECFNQTLSWCLAKGIDNDQQNWAKKIDTIPMGYWKSRHQNHRN